MLWSIAPSCWRRTLQRAVDSIKGTTENGEVAAKDADGEKKEPTMKEKAKMMDDALSKIFDILAELPPDAAVAASMVLRTVLPGSPMGGMAGMLMMGGPFAPSPFKTFGTPMDSFFDPMPRKQITAQDLLKK